MYVVCTWINIYIYRYCAEAIWGTNTIQVRMKYMQWKMKYTRIDELIGGYIDSFSKTIL